MLDLNKKEISSISLKSLDSFSSDYSKSYNALETTEDIINAIIDVYNKNYRDHDLSLLQEKSNDKISDYIDYKALEGEEEEEENNDENEEEESDEESKNESNEIKKRNNEILDLCLSSSLQPAISTENLTLIKNILNLGERYQVNLTGVQMTFKIKKE